MNPLRNLTILVTRPTPEKSSPDLLTQMLIQSGAAVIPHPVIEILSPLNWNEVDLAIANWHKFEWFVFTSPHGVRFFLSRCRQLGIQQDAWDQKKIGVVGDQTGEVLKEFSLLPHLIPPDFESRSLANELNQRIESKQAAVLVIRGSRGSRVLPDSLKEKGVPYQEVLVYRSVDIDCVQLKTKEMLEAGKIDWTTITSSAIARSCVKLFGDGLLKTKLVSISPQTSAVLKGLGFQPAAEAKNFSMAGVLEAMIEFTE